MQKRREICAVIGCGKASKGRQYCENHITPVQRRKLTDELSSLMRSDCCNAGCVIGTLHDNGERYCVKCKEPCIWKVQR